MILDYSGSMRFASPARARLLGRTLKAANNLDTIYPEVRPLLQLVGWNARWGDQRHE